MLVTVNCLIQLSGKFYNGKLVRAVTETTVKTLTGHNYQCAVYMLSIVLLKIKKKWQVLFKKRCRRDVHVLSIIPSAVSSVWV